MARFKSFALAGIAAIALAATPASAATLLYSFSSTSGNYNFSFTLDINPTPSFVVPGLRFVIFNVPITTNFGAETGGVNFDSPLVSGGLGVQTLNYSYILDGPQLYSGPQSSPTMLTGQFALTGITSFPGGAAPVDGTLNVSEVIAAVPEPATWAMMLLGFGFVGGAIRSAKRRQKITVSYA